MPNRNVLKKRAIIWILIVLLPILCCFGSWFYLTTFRNWDLQTCVPKAAGRIGVEPNRLAIYNWIQEKIILGKTREETETALEKLGPVNRISTRILSDDSIEDTLYINICTQFLNNITLYAKYSMDGKLIAITIDYE